MFGLRFALFTHIAYKKDIIKNMCAKNANFDEHYKGPKGLRTFYYLSFFAFLMGF